MTRFGILGPLAATTGSGESVRLRSDHQRTLLAMLLCHVGKVVSVDHLVEALWPRSPPKSYTSNLHTYVSRLRDRLGDVPIDHVDHGYRLRVAAHEVDSEVFKAEVAEGRSAAENGDMRAAAGRLRRALAQWRGPALADVDVPRLDPVVSALETERVTATEDWLEAEIGAGRHAEIIVELERFLTRHPLRERAAAQLMLALRQAGRQADALAVYTRTRTRLVEELGIEPGEQLRRAQTAVLLGHDPGRDRTTTVTATPWPICQLPRDIADFYGRDAELDRLKTLLTGVRETPPVAVVSGAPGVGKSALAVHAAHDLRQSFPDGQLYVHLSGTSSPRAQEAVLADLLRALGVPGQSIPDDPHARAAIYRGKLTDRRVLVVLDDAASPEQVRPLLPGTPGSAALVTSSRRLSALDDANRVSLDPLTDAEAFALLERIVGRQRLSAEPASAGRIVSACGHLPLALRIAGTRLAMRPEVTVGHLADRLDDQDNRLSELAGSDTGVGTSIALSYQALSPLARSALRALALCGDISAPAWAIGVLVGEPGADAAIDELVEGSLLVSLGADRTGEPRYRLHDLVRVFARQRSNTVDTYAEQLSAVRGIVDATLELADAAARKLPWTVPMPALATDVAGHSGPGAPVDDLLPRETVARLVDDPSRWFAIEQHNLVTVIGSIFRIGWHREALSLLERLSVFLWLHRHYADLRTCYEDLLRRARKVGEQRVEAWARAHLAVVVHARGEHAMAERGYRACVAAMTELGEHRSAAWLTANLAGCLLGLGRPAEGLRTAARAVELLGTDPAGLDHAESIRTEAFIRLGRLDDAVSASRERLARARLRGDPLRLASALHGLAWALALSEDFMTARDLAEESVSLFRRIPAPSLLARSLRTLAAVCAGSNARDEAVATYTEAHDIAHSLGERPRQLSCARAIAAFRVGQGRTDEAIATLRECVSEFRAMSSVPSVAITLRVLARAYHVAGESAAAEQAEVEGIRLADPRDANAATLVSLLLQLSGEAGHEPTATCPATPPVDGIRGVSEPC